MPARWICCPVSGELLSFKDCLTCAAKYEGQVNPKTGAREMCSFRYPYLLSLAQANLKRKSAGISSTMMTGCLRAKWMDIHLDYAIDPQKAMASGNGTAWHEYMDQHNTPDPALATVLPLQIGVTGEQRLLHALPSGRTITGQFDRLIEVPAAHRTQPEGITEYWIEDYKRKEDDHIFREAPDYYVLQLNIYRLMLERGCTNSATGEIHYPGKAKVTRLVLLPSSHKEQGSSVEVQLLDLDALTAYLEECLDLWHEGTRAVPPPRYTQPETTYFCRHWCTHLDACKRAGGEPYDPKFTLFEQTQKEVS